MNRCSVPNSHCVDEIYKCQCNQGFVESPDAMRCITETVHLGQPCEMNEQCVRFDRSAACEEGVCRCLKNFTEHDTSCRSLVLIGQHCISQVECQKFTTNVTCIDHKCACEKNFVASDNGNVSSLTQKPFQNYSSTPIFSCACPSRFTTKTVCNQTNVSLALGRGRFVITENVFAIASIRTLPTTNELFAREKFYMATYAKNIPTACFILAKPQ